MSIFCVYVNKIIDFGFQNFIFPMSSNSKYMVTILFAQTQAISFESPNRLTPPHVISKVEFLLKNSGRIVNCFTVPEKGNFEVQN